MNDSVIDGVANILFRNDLDDFVDGPRVPWVKNITVVIIMHSVCRMTCQMEQLYGWLWWYTCISLWLTCRQDG
jgi:hypothetical protein